jgi:hypothetical protein
VYDSNRLNDEYLHIIVLSLLLDSTKSINAIAVCYSRSERLSEVTWGRLSFGTGFYADLSSVFKDNPPRCFLVETQVDLYGHLPAPSVGTLQLLAATLEQRSSNYKFSKVLSLMQDAV